MIAPADINMANVATIIRKMMNIQKYDLAKLLLFILFELNENTIRQMNPAIGIEKSKLYPKYAHALSGRNCGGNCSFVISLGALY